MKVPNLPYFTCCRLLEGGYPQRCAEVIRRGSAPHPAPRLCLQTALRVTARRDGNGAAPAPPSRPGPPPPRTWLHVAGELHPQGAAAQLGPGVGEVVSCELSGSVGGAEQGGLGAALGGGGAAGAAGPGPQAGRQAALQAVAVAAGAVGGAAPGGAGLGGAPPGGGVRPGGRRFALRRPQRRGGVREGTRGAAGPGAAAGSAARRRGSLAAAGGGPARLAAAPSAQQREADAEPAARPPQPSARHLRPRLQEKRGGGGEGSPSRWGDPPVPSLPRVKIKCLPPPSFSSLPAEPEGRCECGLGAGLLGGAGAAARSGDCRGMAMCNIPGASLASDFPSASL